MYRYVFMYRYYSTFNKRFSGLKVVPFTVNSNTITAFFHVLSVVACQLQTGVNNHNYCCGDQLKYLKMIAL
jgi:hypothetical protein